jgi:hypothetical protein
VGGSQSDVTRKCHRISGNWRAMVLSMENIAKNVVGVNFLSILMDDNDDDDLQMVLQIDFLNARCTLTFFCSFSFKVSYKWSTLQFVASIF